jgi:hypothetical protein
MEGEYEITAQCGTDPSSGSPLTASIAIVVIDRYVELTINQENDSVDDLIGHDVQWTTLNLELVNGEEDKTYTVTDIFSLSDGEGSIEKQDNLTLELTTETPTAEVRVKGTALGGVTISATVDDENCAVKDVAGSVVKPIKRPYGDPTINPNGDEGPNDTNEISYINKCLKVNCVANRVVKNTNAFRWRISGSSPSFWRPSISGDNMIGKGETSCATYGGGLPKDNSEFGIRSIALTAPEINNEDESITKVEFFYHKKTTDNPSGTVPNWFYYWKQTVDISENIVIVYKEDFKNGAFLFGEENTKIYLGKRWCDSNNGLPYVGESLTGIDSFSWVVRHEYQHYIDVSEFWNNSLSNYLSHQGKAGDGDDLDGDYIPNIQEKEVIKNSTLPKGEYDWKKRTTLGAVRFDFEDWDYYRNKNVKGIHKKDWSNPGMQHQTIGTYDD